MKNSVKTAEIRTTWREKQMANLTRTTNYLFQPAEYIVMNLNSGSKDENAKELVLTNLKVIKNSKDGKNRNYRDVSLKHISSIEYEKDSVSIMKLLLGLALLIGGGFFTVGGGLYEYDFIIGTIGFICAVIGLVLFIKAITIQSAIKIFTSSDKASLTFNINSKSLSTQAAEFISKVYALSNHIQGNQ